MCLGVLAVALALFVSSFSAEAQQKAKVPHTAVAA